MPYGYAGVFKKVMRAAISTWGQQEKKSAPAKEKELSSLIFLSSNSTPVSRMLAANFMY
jgi:hypothetical protein